MSLHAVASASFGPSAARARLLLAVVDLAWLGPGIWLVAALLGIDPTRATLAFVALQPAGLALGLLPSTWLGPLPLRIALRLLVSAVLLALAAWIGLFAPIPLLDGAWPAALPRALLDTPYRVAPEALLLPAGALLLWRGAWLSAIVPSHRAFGASFQLGLVSLGLMAFLGSERYGGQVLGAALAFLAAGLLALAVARSDEAGARRDSVARAWALAFTAVLLVAALIASLGGGVIVQTLVEVATRAFDVLLGAVAAFFAWLSGLFGPPEDGTLPPTLAPERQPGERNPLADILTVPEPVRRVGGVMVMLGLLAPILIAAVRYLGELWRWLSDPLFMAGVRVAPLESDGNGLRQMLRQLAYRLGKLLWRAAGGRALEGDPHAWPVRLAYRDLLRWAARRGAPRAGAATPSEYLGALNVTFPDAAEDLLSITRAYERARYGRGSDRREADLARARVRHVTRRRWFGR